MHASHHTLSLLAADLSTRLRRSSIRSIFTQEKDELCIAFADRPETLFISCAPDLPVLFLHASFVRAKRNSADILARAIGELVENVRIHPTDRVLNLILASGLCVEIQLFGPRSNVYLLDQQMTVLDAFKKSRRRAAVRLLPPAMAPFPTLSQLIAHGARGLHPAAAGRSPVAEPDALSRSGASTAVRTQEAAPATVYAALKHDAPTASPVVLRELFHRAHLSTELPLKETTPEQWNSLDVAGKEIESELALPCFRLVSSGAGGPLLFSTIRLGHLPGAREEVYSDLHAALQEFFTRMRSSKAFHQERLQLRSLLQRRIRKSERVCEAIRTDTAESDRAAAYRGYGLLLMAHLDDVPGGASAWIAPGGESSGAIPLVPSLSAVQNAQRYFEKAKSAERSRALAGERLRHHTMALARLRQLLAEVDAISTRSALRLFMKQQKESLRSLGALDSPEDRERTPFRVFVVHGGFEVWAGKSSANNDELTLHHARPEDLWFHARGASGSHVILKVSSAAGEPGKRARAEAAGIAAYYSKMKNARLVPVAMTRRKYVHKPKGAPPGTVVIAREEVIMAAPALPPDHTHKTGDQHADA